MFTLTNGDLENESSIYIWKLEMMILLKNTFAFIKALYTIKFTEQKWNNFYDEISHINLYMNIGISKCIIEFSTEGNEGFIYVSSLNDHWSPSTLNALVYNSGEMERCEKRSFQILKMRKKKISWNIKAKCVTYYLLTVRFSNMKDYTCYYRVSK